MSLTDLERRLDFAVDIARDAGALTLRYFRSPELEVETKPDGTCVTVADRQAERLLRECIEDSYPDDTILGEEEETRDGTSGCTWILDPIDGTESFRRGVPLYGILIGLEADGEMVLGVVNLPAAGELVCAARGLGARWHVGDGRPREARVSGVRRIEEAMICTTATKTYGKVGRPDLFTRLAGRARHDRGWSDCYGHVLVATGRADIAIDPLMNLWDSAALLPVVEGAGGRFTDLSGERTIRGGNAISTNGHLHDALLAAIAE
ncbi:MAG: inositol monophosphatase family protein [Planctomycetota bacterium]|nr:inositol monophosphatase family protein [Planctomycetota bacterium]